MKTLPKAEQPPLISARNLGRLSYFCLLFLSKTNKPKKKNPGKKEDEGGSLIWGFSAGCFWDRRQQSQGLSPTATQGCENS